MNNNCHINQLKYVLLLDHIFGIFNYQLTLNLKLLQKYNNIEIIFYF
jgi:hypothetical protein